METISQTVVMPTDLCSSTLRPWIDAIGRFDEAGWSLALVGNCDKRDPLDGLAMAAFCAAQTEQIGLCAVVHPDIVEPFTLARGLATLDHMSGGRAAWRLAPGGSIARTLELVETVRSLLASWDTDAIVENREQGLFSDPAKVRAIAHEGAWFQVEGPLNMPRPPQGAVPLIALDDEGPITGAADLVLNAATLWATTLDALPADLKRIPGGAETPFLSRLEALQ